MTVEEGGAYGVYINAYKESPVENLQMINCNFSKVGIPVQMDHTRNLQFQNLMINGNLISGQ